MIRLFSYVVKHDLGSAPNPFWNICTLTICKALIRKTAKVGDWIIGKGSKKTKLSDGKIYDFSDSIVYAMKVSDKMTMEKYDTFCKEKYPNKIPKWFNKDWRVRLGDSIYDFSNGQEPIIRKSVQ